MKQGENDGIEFEALMDSVKRRKRNFLDFIQRKYNKALTRSILTSQR